MFHHGKNEEPVTHGWVTVFPYCTSDEHKWFDCFLRATADKPYTEGVVQSRAVEMVDFAKNIIEAGYQITKA